MAELDDYLNGFLDVSADVIVDGTWMLDRPEFWMGHLYAADCDDGLIEKVFGRDLELAQAFHREIVDPTRWPILRIRHDRCDLSIIYRNCSEDEGIDFLLHPAGQARSLPIAFVDGHYCTPGLSWPELDRICRDGLLGTRAQRLILLLPAYGDADPPADALASLSEALLGVGARRDALDLVEELASQLIDDWDDARWSVREGALVCDDDHSLRTPASMADEDLALITRCLSA